MEELVTLNYNLQKQISQITDINLERMQQKRILWLTAYQKRQGFLSDLKESMEKMIFQTKKERSKFYSDNVVEYDKNNSEVWY